MSCSRCHKRQAKIMLWSLPEQILEHVCKICERRAKKESIYVGVMTHNEAGILSDKIKEKTIFI